MAAGPVARPEQAAPEARPRRRRMSGAERRREILTSAMEVLARQGYHAASIDDIAQAAGVSKALIYEHFDSKEALKNALVEEHGGELLRRVAQAVDATDPADQQLYAGLDAFFGFVQERQVAWAMLHRDAVEVGVHDALRAMQAGAIHMVTTMYESANGGALPHERAEMLAQMLTGGTQALATWWLDHPDVPRRQVVEAAMESAWVGLEELRGGRRYRRPGSGRAVERRAHVH
ncbi:MAG: TetR/AcrR family transcriptional regulator [Solirubrobacteraceae bacterium]|nr:TetR/AcrR family transcriptional regulator [Solirubrobacteraceae bacterium]